MQTPTRNINILALVLTNACDMVSSVHVVDGIIGSDHNAVADLEIQKGGFRYACSRWSTKQEHKHTHNFLNEGNYRHKWPYLDRLSRPRM